MAAGGWKMYAGIVLVFVALLSDSHVASMPVFQFNTSSIDFIRAPDNNFRAINLSVPVVYLGHTYNQLYITKDGLVSFGQKVDYQPQDWSAPDVSSFIDNPFIAPYYFDAQGLSSMSDYTGTVVFQEFNTQQLINTNLSQYIRSQVIGSGGFNADWAMQITWINVTSRQQIQNGGCRGTYINPCPVDTFQLVLASDGSDSYAIFNYGDMQKQPEKFEQAGFNGGHGRGWTNVLTTGGSLDQLTRLQGSDTVGRYIFKISTGQIFRGGCSNDPNHLKLSIYPSYAGMFGGKMIDISGPCFRSTDNIMCRFGKQQPGGSIPPEVKAIYVSPTRVRCVVPRLLFRDRIILSLSMSGQGNYQYSAPLTIVYPGRLPKTQRVIPDKAWFDKDPSMLTLTWTGGLLSNDPNALVDIRLIGYRETSGKSEYQPLATLGTSVRAASGTYTLRASDYQCVQQDCFNYEIGVLTVSLQDQFTPSAFRSLSSLVIPLGWWNQNAMSSRYGSNWPAELCVDWYNKDRQDTTWSQHLLHCPCSLSQALADFGRWQPDTGCSIQNTNDAHNCFYHKEAIHCVRAVQAVDGAGNQCCYGNTGQLIFAMDTFQGSTPDRSHTWGAVPYGVPGRVPSLSHWIDDVVSFYYCCLWTGYDHCDYYMDLRPTKDCAGYVPPVLAGVFGQGHLMPFAGADFKFRVVAEGDYVLFAAGNTTIQGRFRENLFQTQDGITVKSVYSLVGVAVQDQGLSDRVELELRGPQNNNDYQKIDVKVNGELIQFDQKALAWHDFTGVSVINTDVKRLVMSNFTVILTNGIGLQVIETANTLQMDVMVPSNMNNITGLFGDLDGNFRVRNGSMVYIKNLRINSNLLYTGFERSWAVKNKSESLFQDFKLKISGIIVEPTRVPGTSTQGICGSSMECNFDYYNTGSIEIARSTKDAEDRLMQLRQFLKPVRSCGALNVPRASKNNYNYTLGTTTTITRCRVGSLSGPSTYTCIETSNQTQAWSPAVTSVCKETPEDASVGLIVGIVVAAVAVIIILIVIIVVWKRRGSGANKKQQHEMNQYSDDPTQAKMEPSPSHEYSI